ncbi:hypothetical protein ACH429_06405 [Streptomyces pathocidini]|uniref:Uncharacterized protein n=1 Tax=Streptomyces pathocidini TaxID=1650571 RepID=A0ABW7UM73_9ACTN|nr:hypothetical protein [Streptomyces pathocidini]
MTDLPPSLGSAEGSDAKLPRREAAPAARPQWVNVFAAIGIALVVAFVTLHLAGGGMRSHG